MPIQRPPDGPIYWHHKGSLGSQICHILYDVDQLCRRIGLGDDPIESRLGQSLSVAGICILCRGDDLDGLKVRAVPDVLAHGDGLVFAEAEIEHYHVRPELLGDHTGGEQFHVKRQGDTIQTELLGSENPLKTDGSILKIPFSVTIKNTETAIIKINGNKHTLTRGISTGWINVKFNAAVGIKVHGICKFLLINAT